EPNVEKQEYALSVGRLWVAGKQANLLLRDDLPLTTILVGPEQSPAGAIASAQSMGHLPKLWMKGAQSEAELRQLFARAAIYIATSRYEPFDMAAVEAAFSRCAIVANDIPAFREIWGDTALYFCENDAASLASTIRRLSVHRDLCRTYGNRAYQRARECFTSKRM